MLQVHTDAPVKGLEHAELLDGKPRPAQRHWVVAGEGLPLLFAMATCMGALSYLQLPFEPNLAITLMLSAGVIGLAWGLHKWAGSPPTRLGLVLTAGLALGFAAGLTRANTVSGNAITAPAGPLLVEGWVSDMEPGPSGTRLRLRVHAIAGMDKGDVPRSVRLTHRLDLRVSSGRFVRCWAVLRPPPGPAIPADYNFRRSAWFEGLGAVGYVQGRCRGGVLGAPERLSDRLELFLAAKRRQLALYTQSVAGERAGGFAAALVAGDRSLMPVADQEALRQSGLAHLLAISGLHLGIVGGLIYFIVFRLLALIEPLSLRYPVQKVAALTAVAATLVYLLISGASVSTQRAFIMSTVFFGAVLFDRPAISFRSFSIAMMAVVALRPESVVSPGFQMSFAATGVLIAVYESWSRRRRFGRNGWLEQVRFGAASIAVTSLAASAATAPFAIFHFERIAPLGIFANLVAMPIVSVLAVPSAGLAILLAPFGFAHIGLRLFGQSLELILAVAHMAAAAGDALVQPLPAMPPFTLLGCVAGLLAVAALRGWSRLIISLLIVGAAAVSWFTVPAPHVIWSPSGEVYLAADRGSFSVVPYQESDRLGPLRLSTATPLPACQRSRCLYDVADGKTVLLIGGQGQTPPCWELAAVDLVLSAAPLDCANVVQWASVLDEGGAEIKLTELGVAVRHPRPCGQRPWHPCHE